MATTSLTSALSARKIPKETSVLLAALQFKNANLEGLYTLSDNDWLALLSFCELSHLTFSLQQLDSSRFPQWVVERLEKNASDNAQRFELIKETYFALSNAFKNSGVHYTILKGFSLSPDYVSDPRLRMQSDIDLYCSKETLSQAHTALSAIGYENDMRMNYSAADHVPTMVRKTEWVWRGNMFDPEMPLSIDLHFCVWNEKTMRFAVPGVNDFWSRRVIRAMNGMSFPAFCKVDNLAYNSLHVLRDILKGDWIIHHVYELATFLHEHANDRSFWKSWQELHPAPLRALQSIPFALAKSWFGCDIPEEVEAEWRQLPAAIQGWLHRFSNSPLEVMFQINKDYLWLHLSLIDSFRDKRSVARAVLFPARIPHLKTVAVDVSNRQPRKFKFSQPHFKYLVYFSTKVATHISSLLVTLWNGFSWGLSLRQQER